MGGVIFIHYFISLETAKHLEKWSVSFKNFFKKLNASGVGTCQYPQTYSKSPLEKLHFLCLLW